VAPKSHQAGHCPFCATFGADAALPPPAAITIAFAAGDQPVPPLYLLAPRPLFAWASAQPRAPPIPS
jgi:hypothetical protein